jgi:hypothetical protein
MQQRLQALLEQQQQLQQQLQQLEPEQQQLVFQYQNDKMLDRQQQEQQAARRSRQRTKSSHSNNAAASGRASFKFQHWQASAGAGSRQQHLAEGAAAPGLIGAEAGAANITAGDGALQPRLVETERDRLIRMGVLTPFDRVEGFERRVQRGAGDSSGAPAAPTVSDAAEQQQDVPETLQPEVSRHLCQDKSWDQQQHCFLSQQEQQCVSGDHMDPSADAAIVSSQQQQQQQPEPGPEMERQPLPASSQPASNPAPHAAVDEQWSLLQQQQTAAHDTAGTSSVSGAAAVPLLAAAASGLDASDLAHQVGRSGLSLAQLMAKVSQQSVELGITHRPRAILMEGDQASLHGTEGPANWFWEYVHDWHCVVAVHVLPVLHCD